MNNNRKNKFILLCVLILGCVFTSIVGEYLIGDDNSELTVSNNITSKQEELKIKVYVSGAVKNPGIYDLPINSRADAAINTAGGFTEQANLEKVNLAKKLKDGSQVNVPSLSIKKLQEKQYTQLAKHDNTVDTQKNNNDSLGMVNINTASAAELSTLPGIGNITAQKIIQYRQQKPFQKIEDIMQVKGIGQAKFEMMKSRLTI